MAIGYGVDGLLSIPGTAQICFYTPAFTTSVGSILAGVPLKLSWG